MLACLGLVLGATALVAAVNFAIDPLQQYRAASWYRPLYAKQRYLSPGLVKTRDYDTAMVGTSMIENFKESEIARALGGRALKLPLSGATAHEQGILLETILRVGKAHRILNGVDVFSYRGAPDRFNYGEGSMPLYLYDASPWNDLPYLTSFDTLALGAKVLRANWRDRPKDRRRMDPDFYSYTGDRHGYSRADALRRWRAWNFPHTFEAEDWTAEALIRNFDLNLRPLIEGSPGVRWILFYPPYSMLAWYELRRLGALKACLAFKRHVFDAVGGLGNVEVYDFQTDASITHDLDHYHDVSHYAPTLNARILDDIAAGLRRVTAGDLEAGLAELRRQVETYVPPP